MPGRARSPSAISWVALFASGVALAAALVAGLVAGWYAYTLAGQVSALATQVAYYSTPVVIQAPTVPPTPVPTQAEAPPTAAPNPQIIAIMPSPITARAGDPNPITIQAVVFDPSGGGTEGLEVSFNTGGAGEVNPATAIVSGGVATATFTPGSAPGNYTLTATLETEAGESSLRAPITLAEVLSEIRIEPEIVVAQGQQDRPIEATVLTITGAPAVMDSYRVAFQLWPAQDGAEVIGSLSSDEAFTEDGVARVYYSVPDEAGIGENILRVWLPDYEEVPSVDVRMRILPRAGEVSLSGQTPLYLGMEGENTATAEITLDVETRDEAGNLASLPVYLSYSIEGTPDGLMEPMLAIVDREGIATAIPPDSPYLVETTDGRLQVRLRSTGRAGVVLLRADAATSDATALWRLIIAYGEAAVDGTARLQLGPARGTLLTLASEDVSYYVELLSPFHPDGDTDVVAHLWVPVESYDPVGMSFSVDETGSVGAFGYQPAEGDEPDLVLLPLGELPAIVVDEADGFYELLVLGVAPAGSLAP